MPSTPLTTLFLFLFLALPLFAVFTGGATTSGNYTIFNCGPKSQDVVNLLDQTYLYLQTALLSTSKTAPYKAFFRTASPAPVASERPLIPVPRQLFLLCPSFFELAPSPQQDDCAVVSHAETQFYARSYPPATQYGLLVRALADIYIRDLMPGQAMPADKDVTDTNECLALPPARAVVNPSSYAFFASNVRAGCTNFPSRVPVEPDRELLAADTPSGGNGMDSLTIACVGNGTDSGPCSR